MMRTVETVKTLALILWTLGTAILASVGLAHIDISPHILAPLFLAMLAGFVVMWNRISA